MKPDQPSPADRAPLIPAPASREQDALAVPAVAGPAAQALPRATREAIRDALAAARAASTWRVYQFSWLRFVDWCEARGVSALPADPAAVAGWLSEIAPKYRIGTLRRHLSAVAKAHELNDLPSPTTSHMVKETLRGLACAKGSRRNRVEAATTDIVLKLVATQSPTTLIGLRNRAILLFGFAAALRRSEVAALDVEHLHWEPEGVLLLIPKSKTDQQGEGQEVGVEAMPNSPTCPVAALRAWLRAARIITGPVFRPITKDGKLRARRLTGESIALVVKSACAAAGLDESRFAGHSLRAGHVTSASEAGVPLVKIMTQTRHTSERTVRGYFRPKSRIKGGSSGKLGL